jgi:hypothetical protein
MSTLSFSAEFPKDLKKFLAFSTPEVSKKVIRPAAATSMKILKKNYVSRLKRLPWSKHKTKDPQADLKQTPSKPMFSVIGIRSRGYKDGAVWVGVGPRTKTRVFHAWLVEYGTKPHKIKAGIFRGSPTGKTLLVGPPPFGRPRKIGKFNVFGAVTKHTGSKAGLHLTTAGRATRGQIRHKFLLTVRRRIPVVMQQIAKAKVRRVVVGDLKAKGLKGKVSVK